jgi:hypothetical protein
MMVESVINWRIGKISGDIEGTCGSVVMFNNVILGD